MTTNNIALIEPTNGSYVGTWDQPVNANFSAIDSAFGGATYINVTGVTGPTVALTTAQATTRYIAFQGTLSANLTYQLPAGSGGISVGGFFCIRNGTTGSFTLSFASGTGSTQSITANSQAFLYVSPTTGGMVFADTQFANAAASAAQAAAIAAAESYSSNASNLSSGTVANARLNNVGLGPGVTIQSNPGTTPSGAAGSIWFYY